VVKGHRQGDKAFQQRGLPEIAEMDRVETGVVDQALGSSVSARQRRALPESASSAQPLIAR
jgi:hypothetical protein